MNKKININPSSTKWLEKDDRVVADYFCDLGFRSLKQILDMRVFDLMNMQGLNAVRVEEVIICLYKWLNPNTAIDEARAVIKSKVRGLKCPVCTRNAVLPSYSDLATTDPELAQEWNAAKNTRKPTEISRLSQYPVWWKGICGHEWKDKVFHRAVEGAGCIYCEKAFLKELPYLLVTMYAKQYGLAARTDDEKLIGARIDAVIPELRLAFAFSQKGTDREAKVAEVLHFLCKAKRIQLFVIRQKDPIALATEIKQAFAKANLFINSDSQRDVAHLRKRYFAQKNDGN